MMRTKLTRSLLAACSIAALTVVAYGCSSGVDQADFDAEEAARIAAEKKAADEEAAREAAEKKAAAEQAAREAAEKKAADEQAAREAAEKKAADEEAARKAAEEAAQKKIDDAVAALGSAGGAAEMAETELGMAEDALISGTNMVTMAALNLEKASGDDAADAQEAYDEALAALGTKEQAYEDAAAALSDAIPAYEDARAALNALDSENAALDGVAAAIAGMKRAAADETALTAADIARQVAANTADPAGTKAAYDAAVTAHAAAMTTQATEKTELDAAEVALDEAEKALEDASGDGLAAAVIAYRDAVAALAAAQGEYDAAVANTAAKVEALDAAFADWKAADPTAEGLQSALAQIEELKKQQAADKKAADAAKDALEKKIKALEKQVADLIKAEEDRKADLAAAEATKKAKAVDTAIRAASGTAPAYTVSATASDMEVKVATPTGYADTGEAAIGAAGWRGRTLAKGDDMLVVYSDIANATPTLFGLLYNGTITNGMRRYTMDSPASTGVDSGEIDWAHVKRDNNSTSTDLKGSGDADNETTFSGSVSDVSGTFYCIGATCNIAPRNTDGTVTVTDQNTSDTWSFAPTDSNATVAVQDDDYLSLGWWLSMAANGSYSYDEVVMGHGDFADDIMAGNNDPTVANIDGTATYKGAAAGKYSFVDTVEDEADAGHWTATATLTADFDVDNDPAADGDDGDGNLTNDDQGVSLTGELTNFMGGSDTRDVSGWKVTLNAVDTNGATAGTPSPTDFTAQTGATGQTAGTTSWSLGSGAANGTGNWSYTWRGPTPAANSTAQPSAVTGNFEASIGQRAHITGAYGATKEAPAN